MTSCVIGGRGNRPPRHKASYSTVSYIQRCNVYFDEGGGAWGEDGWGGGGDLSVAYDIH